MKVALVVLAIVVVLLLGALGVFVAWRLWATHAGARDVYLRLTERIAPVETRLSAGQEPAAADLQRFAGDRETRQVLYDALKGHDRLALFPKAFGTPELLAEGALVLWLCHPNELAAPPDEIERMAEVPAPASQGRGARYFVFRFRTKPPHWAAKDGWMAGIAGPYDGTGPLPVELSGTFSRFEAFDSRTPEEHVRVTLEATGIK